MISKDYRTANTTVGLSEKLTRTLSVPSVHVVLRKLLQVVFEEHLVSWYSLYWFQHVMLQRQTPTHFLLLYSGQEPHKKETTNIWQQVKVCKTLSVVNTNKYH